MSVNWWSPHVHSRFSVLDGMASPEEMIAKAASYGHSSMGLTDHGNAAGWVQAYQAGKKHGVQTFLGVEGYLLDPSFEGDLAASSKADRFHVGLLALDLEGYQALTKFISLTHTRPRFSRFPRHTLSDLAQLGQDHGDHLAIMTGCVFGWVERLLLDKGPEEARRAIKMYAQWFPNTYVEVQNHYITHEDGKTTDAMIAEQMIQFAQELSLPVVATSDTHYCNSMDKPNHALMKKMVYGGREDAFPGDSFHYPHHEWVQEHWSPEQWSIIEEGHVDLAGRYRLKIPPLDTFKAHVPFVAKNPQKVLADACWKALNHLDKKGLLPTEDCEKNETAYDKYADRLEYELDVIEAVGMAPYFLLFNRFVAYLRSKHVAIEARGSANGSLVCYLSKITQVDPIFWRTDFDRFMAKDRLKMPDIDMDIEDSERWRALEFASSNFDTMQIGTFAELGMTVDPETGEMKGSIFRSYLTYFRRKIEEWAMRKETALAESEGRKPVKYKAQELAKGVFFKKTAGVKSLGDMKEIAGNDYDSLVSLSKMKIYRSYGVHAAGVLISAGDMPIESWIPTMLVASSDTTVTQYTMDDVENLGLLKMDWLGQTTLAVMKRCQQMIGRADPTDFTWIPNDDKKALAACREGRTDTGIFHVEGWTKSRGAGRGNQKIPGLMVRSTSDLILVQALYMPGAMESGATRRFVAARRNQSVRSKIKYLDKITEDVLGPTFGELIYQEQVLNIARAVGMDGNDLQSFFKVIKDSGKGAKERNAVRLAEAKRHFVELAISNRGIARSASEQIFETMAAMGSYGFNKAHATGYGIRSYRTAYLKAHYPVQYMTALLQCWAGREKEAAYLAEARRIKLVILPPDVNVSGASWTLDDPDIGSIRRGLQSIKGIGEVAATEIADHAPYKSIADLIRKTNPRKVTGGKTWHEDGKLTGVLEKLLQAGALDSLLKNPPPF